MKIKKFIAIILTIAMFAASIGIVALAADNIFLVATPGDAVATSGASVPTSEDLATLNTYDVTKYYDSSDSNNFVYFNNVTEYYKGEEIIHIGLSNDYKVDFTKIKYVSYYVTLNEELDWSSVWYGGQVGTNSSFGWNQIYFWTSAANENGKPDGGDVLIQDTIDGNTCVLTFGITDGVFTNPSVNSKDEILEDWSMVWLQSYGSEIGVTKVIIYYDGVLEPINDDKEETLLGDVNGDGSVTAIDARLALQAAAGNHELDETAILAADVNGDGKVTSIDARLILQAAAGNLVL